MKNRRGRAVFVGSMAACWIVAPHIAHAQGTQQGHSANEIIVTANKREQSLLDVPSSVSALDATTLETRGINDIDGVQYAVPSLQIGSETGVTLITIRGVGANSRQSQPSVGVFIDGVFLPNSVTANITQSDLERIEVIRGPQSTLYGKNTNGGAINFVSRSPSDELEAQALARYGSFDKYSLQGLVNIPLSDAWGIRASVDYTNQRSGHIKNIVTGGPSIGANENISGRVRLSGEITPSLQADLLYMFERTEGHTAYLAPYGPISAALVFANPVLASAQIATDKFRTATDVAGRSYRSYHLAAATLAWDTPVGELKSISAYQYYNDQNEYDADGTSADFIRAVGQRTLSETISEELTLSSKIGNLDTIVGLFYLDNDDERERGFLFPNGLFLPQPPPNPPILRIPPGFTLQTPLPFYDTKTQAAYIDATLNIGPGFRLLGGIRYSEDEIKAHLPSCMGAQEFPSVKFSSTTWRVGAQADVGQATKIFGTVSTGFKSGGIANTSCGQVYDPEEVTAYEIGIKNRLLGGKMQLNLSGFYYDYKNLQVDQLLIGQVQIRNAAAASITGMEVELQYRPIDEIFFQLNGTYLDAEYGTFLSADELNRAAGVQDLSGNRMRKSPRLSFNAGMGVDGSEQSWGSLFGRIDMSYRSDTYLREFNDPLDRQDAYMIVNLSAGWRSPGEHFTLRLFANNVTNEAYFESMGNLTSQGQRYITWGEPRRLGIEAAYKF